MQQHHTQHISCQARRRVLLLERDLAQPDRIVGELLQPGGYVMLKKLGLEACVDGIDAQRVYGYCMFKGGREAKVAYPVEGYSDDVAGRSFHNGRFVQRLRQAAAAQPTVSVRQATVRRLINGMQSSFDARDHLHINCFQKLGASGRMGTWCGACRTAHPTGRSESHTDT